jgi:hypothetical protein
MNEVQMALATNRRRAALGADESLMLSPRLSLMLTVSAGSSHAVLGARLTRDYVHPIDSMRAGEPRRRTG